MLFLGERVLKSEKFLTFLEDIETNILELKFLR